MSEKTIEGTIERITFENASTGFRVLRVRTDASVIPVVGTFPPVLVGARVRVRGRYEVNQKHGAQLVASSLIEIAQSTIEGLTRYLASGAIRGVGKTTARRIVETFGLETMKVLDEAPERLAEVPNLGKRRAATIGRAWAEQKGMREVMVFLQAHGATPGLAARIFKRYGKDAASVVTREPFRLAREVRGVGFATADRMAQGLGIAKDAPERIQAGLLQAMDDTVDDGHTFAPKEELRARAAALLGVRDEEALERAKTALVLAGDLFEEDRALYRPDLFRAEVEVARALVEMTGAAEPELRAASAAIARFEKATAQTLAPEQRRAIETAATARVLVITGGPGTGKTTIVRALLELFSGLHVRLAAPTGRAAKRITETTGREACTLHRLLEIDPQLGKFRRERERPIEAAVVIVDEVSMVDLPMADALLAAVGERTRLVLVGDVDQLPSVGPGAFLRDVIASEVIPCVRLARVFRQGSESLIVENAHRINAGKEPRTSGEGGDFFLVEREPERAADTVLTLVKERIPRAFGLDPIRDVQVLVPMHRGEAGAAALNAALQDALNPTGPELARGGRRYRAGDKVMQLRNDYDKDVFNGDLGVIAGIEEDAVRIRFEDGRLIEYEGNEIDDLALSYACTVHKSQGSEYPAVVVVLLTSHFVMLSRNLLYTAVTRGKRLVVVVGQRRAVRVALREDRRGERKSQLAARLRSIGGMYPGALT